MAILEAIMVIIGLGAVFLSFRAADGNSTDTSTSSASGEELENVTDKAKEVLDKFNGDIEIKAEEVLNNTGLRNKKDGRSPCAGFMATWA